MTKQELTKLTTDEVNAMLEKGLLRFISSKSAHYAAIKYSMDQWPQQRREGYFLSTIVPRDADYYTGGMCKQTDSSGTVLTEDYSYAFFKNKDERQLELDLTRVEVDKK